MKSYASVKWTWSTLVQVMACCWRHQAITWTNVDLSVRSNDINLRVILRRYLNHQSRKKLSNYVTSSKSLGVRSNSHGTKQTGNQRSTQTDLKIEQRHYYQHVHQPYYTCVVRRVFKYVSKTPIVQNITQIWLHHEYTTSCRYTFTIKYWNCKNMQSKIIGNYLHFETMLALLLSQKYTHAVLMRQQQPERVHLSVYFSPWPSIMYYLSNAKSNLSPTRGFRPYLL